MKLAVYLAHLQRITGGFEIPRLCSPGGSCAALESRIIRAHARLARAALYRGEVMAMPPGPNRSFVLLPLLCAGLLSCCHGSALGRGLTAAPVEPRTLECNRAWDVLPEPSNEGSRRDVMALAGEALGDWHVHIAGVEMDGRMLRDIAQRLPGEPFLRVAREAFGRPVDLDDLLLFLDDVLRAGKQGLRGQRVWVTSGRARKAGILVHPDDVWGIGPGRRYGGETKTLSIDQPRSQLDLPPALDGDPLGPGWTMRYQNPKGEEEMLSALSEHTGSDSFATRIASLMRQLRSQGAEVYLNSTLRSPERGYLMWGAFELSRAPDEPALLEMLEEIEAANRSWGLNLPIVWRAAGEWRATRESAREMADSYEVVFATQQGARSSQHYTGKAVDLVALALPRHLALRGADGAEQVFDLSGESETRDLSLSPGVIAWVEAHFELAKLRSDYPHWNDASTNGDGTKGSPR